MKPTIDDIYLEGKTAQELMEYNLTVEQYNKLPTKLLIELMELTDKKLGLDVIMESETRSSNEIFEEVRRFFYEEQGTSDEEWKKFIEKVERCLK